MRRTYIITRPGYPIDVEYQGDSIHWDPHHHILRIYSGENVSTRELISSCTNVERWSSRLNKDIT